MATATVVSPAAYLPSRLALLEKEKAHTRAADALAAQRRALPLVEISKPYTFTGLDASGAEESLTLTDLFAHRRQLIIRHFMFAPDWDAGCTSCTLGAEYLVALEHFWARDTSVVVVSRAPIAKIEAYKKRMGWTFPWVSSNGSEFNYDFHATQDPAVKSVEYNFRGEKEHVDRGMKFFTRGEQPGLSCFIQGGKGVGEQGKLYHSYSTYSRGMEASDFSGMLDMTFLGRQDEETKQPADKRRDEYSKEELKGSM